MLSLDEQERLKNYVADGGKRLSEIFDALGDNNRCQVFRIFTKRTNLNVSEVAAIMSMSLPLTSQHLKVLESRGLLKREKIGREVFYSVNEIDPVVNSIIKAILI